MKRANVSANRWFACSERGSALGGLHVASQPLQQLLSVSQFPLFSSLSSKQPED